jgi:2-iminobutanoate/2-iminopropanoate deaminase
MPHSTPRTLVKTPMAPAAIGPYSQAVQVGNTLFCSGQIPIDPSTGSLISGTIEQETERVFENLRAVLKGASMDLTDVVRVTVFLTSMDDYGQVNEVYARYFSDTLPARETVAVSALPRGARIEISCTAVS